MTRKQIIVLITLALGVFMGALDMSIVSPAFTTLQSSFAVPANIIIWTITIYTLVYVISQPLTGKIADRSSRKWVYILCVALFGLGSLICGLSPDLRTFLIGRAIQAWGAGGILPVVGAVVADTFSEKRRGMALGITGSLFGVAAIIGPNLGGWLTAGHSLFGVLTTSWHDIFFLNVPIAIAVIILAAFFDPLPRKEVKPFDWQGALALSGALFTLVYGLSQLDFLHLLQSLASWPVGPDLLASVLLFALFLWLEKRAPDPLLNIPLFTRRQMIIVSLLSLAAGTVIVSLFFIPVLSQYVLGYRPDQAGSMVTIAAGMLLITTPLTGMLLDRIGARVIITSGAICLTIALFLLSIVPPGALGLFILALSIAGLGLGSFLGTPIRYVAINEAPANERASSLAVVSICNSIGQSIGVPLAGSLIASQTSAVTGLQHFYLFACLVLGATIISSCFLKNRQQEQVTLARAVQG
jgi:EmrB/QacA subfamily drug resistance transporter